MYSGKRQAVKNAQFYGGLSILLVGLCSMAAWAQDAAQGTDSTDAAKPVLPASAAAPDEAKATPLPASNTPASRVPAVHPANYIVGVGDVLEINVWKESELSKTVPVRPDGMITLPLVGEIKAVGLTPDQLTGTAYHRVAEGRVGSAGHRHGRVGEAA